MTRIRLVFAMLSVVLIGCANSGKIPSTEDSATRDARRYIIGPGDTLQVSVWNNPEVSTVVPVRPDGRISTPLVEDLIAVGKSPAELARAIETELSQFIRSPKVTIIVTDFVGTFGNQIRVIGKATNPRAISYRDRMTLLDVMIEVGGLAEFAAGNRSKIIRQVDEGQQEIRVRLKNLISRGDIEENILMQPGDILIIPESRF